MYTNSGAKVKGLASFFAGLGIFGACIGGIATMVTTGGPEGVFAGAIIAAVGSLGAWLSGLLLAAFGELVQNTYEILRILKTRSLSDAPASAAAACKAPAHEENKCPFCGGQIKPGAAFCGFCGGKL